MCGKSARATRNVLLLTPTDRGTAIEIDRIQSRALGCSTIVQSLTCPSDVKRRFNTWFPDFSRSLRRTGASCLIRLQANMSLLNLNRSPSTTASTMRLYAIPTALGAQAQVEGERAPRCILYIFPRFLFFLPLSSFHSSTQRSICSAGLTFTCHVHFVLIVVFLCASRIRRITLTSGLNDKSPRQSSNLG